MGIALISLGSNLGQRSDNIKLAIQKLKGLSIQGNIRVSKLQETKPQQASGPDYINAVARIETILEPEELLIALQKIENDLGRQRPFRNAPRTIDLDILLYDQRVINVPNLTIPHPRMFERDFILKQIVEVEPEFRQLLNRNDLNL